MSNPAQNQKTSNNIAYKIVVEDISAKTKTRSFVTNLVTKGQWVEFRGYETTSIKKDYKTWEEVCNIAKENSLEMLEIMFPWARILSIQNLTYRQKS